MNTKEERRLHAFLFERYCAALACPNAKTQDALANGLRVAHRRVRSTLQACFADENVGADERRELLVVYGALDRGVEEFWTGIANGEPRWVEQGCELVRLVEHAHALAQACRTVALRRGRVQPPCDDTRPAPSASFEEAQTQVFDRGAPSYVPIQRTEVPGGRTQVAAR